MCKVRLKRFWLKRIHLYIKTLFSDSFCLSVCLSVSVCVCVCVWVLKIDSHFILFDLSQLVIDGESVGCWVDLHVGLQSFTRLLGGGGYDVPCTLRSVTGARDNWSSVKIWRKKSKDYFNRSIWGLLSSLLLLLLLLVEEWVSLLFWKSTSCVLRATLGPSRNTLLSSSLSTNHRNVPRKSCLWIHHCFMSFNQLTFRQEQDCFVQADEWGEQHDVCWNSRFKLHTPKTLQPCFKKYKPARLPCFVFINPVLEQPCQLV